MAVGMSSPGPAHTAAGSADGTGIGHLDALSAGLDPDDLPDGLVVADADGRVVCFNAAAARITATPAPTRSAAPWRRPSRWRTSRASAGGR